MSTTPNKPYDFEVVWLSSGGYGFPHADALWASNPDLAATQQTCPHTGEDGWRNCDRNIRAWWKAHRNTVEVDRVLFLEWDVLVTQDLRVAFPARRRMPGMEGASLRTPVRAGRWWQCFGEIPRLPEEMQPYAVGIAPLAVAMMSRDALDVICGEAYDDVFSRDIVSELRLPSVVRYAGFEVEGNSRLVNVTCGPSTQPGDRPGIHHPVKTGGGA
ncbi:MAG: hypothetical protein EOP87_00905 [Verrucomicrobiaceae bacterium]|nr:MAG: hypothetical protein EOP87_00905 [Verrucomicrobiaceae bacterium]